MNKKEYLRRLKFKLFGIDSEEREKALAYYAEMIDDAIDDGMTEAEAVNSMGGIPEAVASIKEEAASQGKLRRKLSGLAIALLIIGFPLWFSILVGIGSVLLSVYVTIWGIIFSLIAVVIVLILCIIPAIIIFIATFSSNAMAALFVLGAGLICLAFGLLLAYPVALAIKWTAKLTIKSLKSLFGKVTGKVA